MNSSSRTLAASMTARVLAVTALLAALAAPAAAADWSAPQTLIRPPLFDAFRIDGAGNATGFEAFAWFHTTRTMRRDPPRRGGYLRYVRARKRLADGKLGRVLTVSRKDVIVDTPRAGVDARSTTTVSWLESRRGRRSPYVMAAVARSNGGFGAPVQLGRSSPEGNLDFGQSMVVAADGSALLAWDDGRRVVAVRRPAGRCSSRSRRACFGSMRVLSGPRVAGARPATAIGPDGSAHVTWMDSTGAIRLASAPRGVGLKASRRVSPAGQPASNPVVAGAGAGSAVIAWRRSPGDSGIEPHPGPIIAAVSDAQGQISAPQTVDPSEAGSFVDVQANRQGEAILLWAREAGGATETLAAVRPPSGSFGSPILISPTGGPGSLAIDDRGDAIVGFGTSAVVRPPGAGFSAPVPVPSTRIIPAGRKLTALRIDDQAVTLSDLVF